MTTNKLLIGVGAIALAATASLSPLVAQAEPAGDTDSSASADAGSVGNAAGRKPARATRGSAGNAQAPQAPQAQTPQAPQTSVNGARSTAANALGPNPLFQNPLWWFGTPNADAPEPVVARNFDALASLPDWARSYYGWYENLNFEACVLGLSSTISPVLGPYGNSTSAVSTGGC
ncbi:hypothetical protein MCEMAEM6B_01385 [Mycobacteriaceae bacterium]